MPRNLASEISEHDQLVLMMARYYKKLGYSQISADIPGWNQPSSIYWTNAPNRKYIPDLTCIDTNGNLIILEAETCSSLNDDHTRKQFEIFRAHATNKGGRFEIVVPKLCSGYKTRTLISDNVNKWGIELDNIWTPGS